MTNHFTIVHDTSAENIAQARTEFLNFLDPSAVISDAAHCFRRSNTPWSSASPDQIPALVVLPSSTGDVASVLRICHQRRIPTTSFAGGTNLAKALVATRKGICIDFQRMDKIIDVHKDDLDAVVQPGVGWEELNGHLANEGLFFPPDPSPGAKVGGMVS